MNLSPAVPAFELTPPEPKQTHREMAEEIVNFLNQKTGRNYRAVPVNTDLICARLKEGATLQDCKSVIALMVRKWRYDQTMKEYLRPATLFNRTKFWQYHGELT